MDYIYAASDVDAFLRQNTGDSNILMGGIPRNDRLSFNAAGARLGGHPGGYWDYYGVQVVEGTITASAGVGIGNRGEFNINGGSSYMGVAGAGDTATVSGDNGVTINSNYTTSIWGANGVYATCLPGYEAVFGQSSGTYFRVNSASTPLIAMLGSQQLTVQGGGLDVDPNNGTGRFVMGGTNATLDANEGDMEIYGRNARIGSNYLGAYSQYLAFNDSGLTVLQNQNGAFNTVSQGCNFGNYNNGDYWRCLPAGGSIFSSPAGNIYMTANGGSGNATLNVGDSYGGVYISCYSGGSHRIQAPSGSIEIDASNGYLNIGNSASYITIGSAVTNLQLGYSSGNMGFFGKNPVSRPTLLASGYETAADVTAALVSLGLCTQAT